MGELADKVVVITGSAFGIGRAIALQASAKGAKVVIADVPAEETAGKRTASECEAAGAPAAMYQPCDVSEGAQVAALMEAAAAAYGSIDVIYANAGVGGVGPGKWAHEVGDDDFAKTVAINLGGVFHAAKYGLPHLVKSQGVLINTGSTFGMVGSHYAPAYCASKGGVINLTRQLAVDYGAQQHHRHMRRACYRTNPL
jgi:NAD(P)-dependent dehydrogenase (short-subunit alcohol dehydrogenase family)